MPKPSSRRFRGTLGQFGVVGSGPELSILLGDIVQGIVNLDDYDPLPMFGQRRGTVNSPVGEVPQIFWGWPQDEVEVVHVLAFRASTDCWVGTSPSVLGNALALGPVAPFYTSHGLVSDVVQTGASIATAQIGFFAPFFPPVGAGEGGGAFGGRYWEFPLVVKPPNQIVFRSLTPNSGINVDLLWREIRRSPDG